MNFFKNEVLKEMYREYDEPCDCLVSNPDLLLRFTQDYSTRCGHIVEPAQLGHHMLNLRKLGETKGGLPRLRRNYNGRN